MTHDRHLVHFLDKCMDKPTTQHNSSEEAGVVNLQGHTEETEMSLSAQEAGARNIKLAKKPI